MIDDIYADAKQRMDKTISVMRENFSKIRTGRASTTLLDHVTVDYYGVEVPLNQAANVSTEDARTISIMPYEKTMVQKIEKAIMTADLGLNPSTAGQVIRVVLPPLTEERRKDLVKVIRQEAEDARVAVRNVRRDANADLKELVKEKEITEDDQHGGEERIQKLTDQHIERIDNLLQEKEQELMTV
ncbi:ribosome recycling factor [Salinisphaera hydrothermalis]|uniref:Ribosome-recycling factor n=1 Tax=Salinisphaera hydrothermalis (strain C41B8) TaxID=1304275 RepID=A0A084IK13_SALHC|nr:ribosome recycling factor [Salinisphaera hydrothermalis]KEZ77047.1 ribosome recycling factor [Salinisphaera hydrothermalis C41B8]